MFLIGAEKIGVFASPIFLPFCRNQVVDHPCCTDYPVELFYRDTQISNLIVFSFPLQERATHAQRSEFNLT